ncbi:hypothetical protein E2320_007904 [Naja naja]|nr:hypothetical protein E2320_007904 [Naja naja]
MDSAAAARSLLGLCLLLWPCIVTLEAKASLEFRNIVSVYKKRWEGGRVWKNQTVNVTFPNSMVFRDDYLIKQSNGLIFFTDLMEINFPYASSGEGTGIVKKFQKFKNRELEAIRKHHLSYPTFTTSLWLYLLHFCERPLCGILYFINSGEMYGTPAVFLTNEGYLHIQMHLVKGGDLAVKTTFLLPLKRWFRLDLSFNGQEINITIVGKNMNIFQHQLFNFQQDFYYDDTDGYLVLGGSGYVPGIKGYFGSVKYYRLNNLETRRFAHPFSNRDISERIEMFYQDRANIQSGVTNHGFSLQYFEENQQCKESQLIFITPLFGLL